jgi:hypothetical protein
MKKMKKFIRTKITLPAFSSNHLLGLFIILSMGGCLGCKLWENLSKLYHQANISLQFPKFRNLEIFPKEGMVEISLLIKNESASDTLYQETLEKITLKITNQNNVHKLLYVTEAKKNMYTEAENDFFFNHRKLVATKYEQIKNNSLNLWELLKVSDLKSLKSWQEKQFILLLYPENITKPSSCTIELEGSQSSKKSVDILCNPFVDLSIKKENVKEVNDDLLCVAISIGNRNGLGLEQDFLQKCIFKVINPQNIKQIFYAQSHKFDGTYNISPISLNDPSSLWDIIRLFNPKGVVENMKSQIKIWVNPQDPAKKFSFRIEVWNHANIISSEDISS